MASRVGEFDQRSAAAWHGYVSTFLKIPQSDWLIALEQHHQMSQLEPPDPSQQVAWRHSYTVLFAQLSALIKQRPEAEAWHVIFEYELPRERGRRPDVVLLAGSSIIVIEFKDFGAVLQAHVDQVAAYARDLAHYHSASHGHAVHALLVPTLLGGPVEQDDEVWVTPPAHLSEQLAGLIPVAQISDPIDLATWLDAEYAPLPSLVAAARTIFRDEPLPRIRRAQSAGIPETIETLVSVANEAQSRRERHLAFVTGVPGAGKTLVGLQFVHHSTFDNTAGGRQALFLSGNGPLVKVLQHALRSRVFVQDIHGFLRQYGGQRPQTPEEHIWVSDEAQRAWDADRVLEKRGHHTSEPEDFLRLGMRMPTWGMMVGLIGEGQEIHLGEEAGIHQWNDAIRASGGAWIVHCPARIAAVFTAAAAVHTTDTLDLTTSLRSHLAEYVQQWVQHLLDGDLDQAGKNSHRVTEQGFELYITRNRGVAESYVRERYAGQEDKHYGLLASSKAKNLTRHGIHNEYSFTKNLREGPWYNDPPDSRRSSCQLEEVATEFACQGLELDFPIIAWGNDLIWTGKAWRSPPQPRSSAHDPHRLRLNSYRVLLTRGRDGFVVFIPAEPSMDSTHTALIRTGLRPLESAEFSKGTVRL